MSNLFTQLWAADDECIALTVTPDYDREARQYLYAIGRVDSVEPPPTRLPGYEAAAARRAALQRQIDELPTDVRNVLYTAACATAAQ